MGHFGVGIPESSNLGHISGLDRFGPVLYRTIHFGIYQSRPFGGLRMGSGRAWDAPEGSKMGYFWGPKWRSQNGVFWGSNPGSPDP